MFGSFEFLAVELALSMNLLSEAIARHQQGDLQAAETLYRSLLASEPLNPDALHLLGVVGIQTNRIEMAREFIERALKVRPAEPTFFGNLALAYEATGNRNHAIELLERAVQLNPAYTDAWSNLGSLYRQTKRLDEAEAALQQSLRLAPDHIDALLNLGVVAMDRAQWSQANQLFQSLLARHPDHLLGLYNQGVVLSELEHDSDAIACFERVLKLDPNSHLAHRGLATVRLRQRRLDAAIDGFQKALRIQPDYGLSWLHLGCALQDANRLDEAVTCLKNAVFLIPENSDAHFNLGRAWNAATKYELAIDSFLKAIELRPDFAEAISMLVNQYQFLCRWDEVEQWSRRLIELVQVSRRWLGAESDASTPRLTDDANPQNLIADRPASGSLVNPSVFAVLPIAKSLALELDCARVWTKFRIKPPTTTFYPTVNSSELNDLAHVSQQTVSSLPVTRRLKIGYMSADFRKHVMASHVVGLFEEHNRERVEITAYSIGPDDRSPIRKRIQAAVDHWNDVVDESYHGLAEKIYRDRIDILVDLQGYSRLARVETLVYKPAPIQVTYLGFPCTLGTSAVDYMMVDRFVAPQTYQKHFVERLVELPGCYQVNDGRMEIDPTPVTRKQVGLPENAFVFCCFNNFFKITPDVFEAWMQILGRVPQSILWLPEHDAHAMNSLRREAERLGIAAPRIIFAPQLPLAQHSARHRLADVFLDTYPYNAHGTAALSLRSGVPIVTLAGETIASRVAGSLLTELSLSFLIAGSIEEYVRIAIELATNPEKFFAVRSGLNQRLTESELFDSSAFARKVENAYCHMFERYQRRLPPSGFQLHNDGSATWQ